MNRERGSAVLYCRRMPGLESDVVPLSPDPVAAPARPFFRPWATWLSTALVALIVGYIFVLTPGDPLDHLRWPEDSLERLAGRDMEVRAAVARAAPWERRLYALMSGGDESVDDWVRWHEELAQVSSSPDVDLDRLILLGEAGRTAAVREGVEEWETHDEAAAQRKAWITAAYLAPSLPRSAGRRLITEVRDELPAGWFADALVARLALRAGDAVTRQQAEAAVAARGAVLLNRWRTLQATGLLLALTKSAEPEPERTPAVPIRRSVTPNYVVCLDCGRRAKMLRGHLQSSHGLTPNEYRARWGLPRAHPLTAPAYSERRSALAKKIGLGQKQIGRRRQQAPQQPA